MFKTTSDGKKWIIFNNALASFIVKHGGRVVSIAPLREDTRFCIDYLCSRLDSFQNSQNDSQVSQNAA